MTHGRDLGNDRGDHTGNQAQPEPTDPLGRDDVPETSSSLATKVVRVTRSHVSGAAAGLLAVTAVTLGVLSVGASDVAPPSSVPTVAATAPTEVSTTAASATGVTGMPGLDPLAAAQLVSAALEATSESTAQPASRVAAMPVSGVIPQRMVEAYKRGEQVAAERAPQCNMPWWLLAGIGRVESGHAAGGAVDANGVTVTRILGPRLDGTTPNTAVILDTDDGRYDGDPHYDRAVGPMQFIPGTWVLAGIDGNGDGVANPSQVDDATASAAMYLCSGGGDMNNPQHMASAILRYNNSTQYVQDVLAGAVAYRDGHVPITPPRKIQAAPENTKRPTQTTTQAAAGAPAKSPAAPVGPAGRPLAPTAPGAATSAAPTTSATAGAASTDPAEPGAATASPTTAAPGGSPSAGPSGATTPTTSPTATPTATPGEGATGTAAPAAGTATPSSSATSPAAGGTVAPAPSKPTATTPPAPPTAKPSATPSATPSAPATSASPTAELPECRPSAAQLEGLPADSPLLLIDWESKPVASLPECTPAQLAELTTTYTPETVEQLIASKKVNPVPAPRP